MATNPKTGKPWTLAQDRADDRKRGIKEGSARDEVIDTRRGIKEEVGKGGNKRRVGKGQGPGMPPGPPPMPGGPPPPGPMPGGAPSITPPAGAQPTPPMPMPPGVKLPMRRRRPVRRMGLGAVAGPPRPGPIVPGVGGGKGKGTTIGGRGQRDPVGNYRAGTNSKGRKIGGK